MRAELVCNSLNTDDAVAAQKCIDDVVAYAAKAQEIHTERNCGDSSSTIGPRALPNNRTQTGSVPTRPLLKSFHLRAERGA